MSLDILDFAGPAPITGDTFIRSGVRWEVMQRGDRLNGHGKVCGVKLRCRTRLSGGFSVDRSFITCTETRAGKAITRMIGMKAEIVIQDEVQTVDLPPLTEETLQIIKDTGLWDWDAVPLIATEGWKPIDVCAPIGQPVDHLGALRERLDALSALPIPSKKPSFNKDVQREAASMMITCPCSPTHLGVDNSLHDSVSFYIRYCGSTGCAVCGGYPPPPEEEE